MSQRSKIKVRWDWLPGLSSSPYFETWIPKGKIQCHIPYSQEKLEISLRSIARCEATVAFRTLKTRRIWASRHPLTTTRVWIEVPEKLCQAPALRHPLLQRAPLIIEGKRNWLMSTLFTIDSARLIWIWAWESLRLTSHRLRQVKRNRSMCFLRWFVQPNSNETSGTNR